MKTPYIFNYAEKSTLLENNLYYDSNQQMNFSKIETQSKNLMSPPDSTQVTETVENSDFDFLYNFKDTHSTAVPPDTTSLTFTSENNDFENCYVIPDTTISTKTLENSDFE